MKQNLDYTNPNAAANFRDVGEFINVISGTNLWPTGRLFRGGTIKSIDKASVIGNPKTIICLQKGPDHPFPGVRSLHFPISNDYEKYDSANSEVRKWLRSIMQCIESGIDFPLYIHCLSGRDRTGVVVAALLKICGASEESIIEEYRLSIGAEEIDSIHATLDGFRKLEIYFSGIDLMAVRNALLTDRQ